METPRNPMTLSGYDPKDAGSRKRTRREWKVARKEEIKVVKGSSGEREGGEGKRVEEGSGRKGEENRD